MPRVSKQPLLTVAVNTYNRWKGCRTAIEALVRSRDERVELLVVDDCSKAQAPDELLAFFEQNDVRYHRHERNSGLATARNTAIRLASGIFYSFCDDDDIWTGDMLPRFLEVCETCPEDVGIIIGYPKPKVRTCEILHKSRPLYQLIAAGITPPVAAQVFRVSGLRQVGGYREHVCTGVDHDIWLSLAVTGCRCVSLFDVVPKIGTSPTADRMTTNEDKRRQGLQETLDIWEPQVRRVFGTEFAWHLRNCYQQHLNYSFFKKSIATKKLSEVPGRLVQYGVVRSLARDVARKTGLAKYCGAFAPFTGAINGSASVAPSCLGNRDGRVPRTDK